MPYIKKILNSSVVLIENENGKESIILGKGIGFGKHKGDVIELNHSEHQIFIPMQGNKKDQMMELLNSIEPEVFETTHEMILFAEKELQTEFNQSLYFTLADHISFAIERMKENMVITNRLVWEIKHFYEKEYQVGLKCVTFVNQKLNVELPEEEAANIVFHLVNAQFTDEKSQDSAKMAKLIGQIVNLAIYSLNKPIDTKSLHYVRFVTHIRYFVERFLTDKMLNDNVDLFNNIYAECQKEQEIANKIKAFLYAKYHKEISQEELVYLIVHINRLNRG